MSHLTPQWFGQAVVGQAGDVQVFEKQELQWVLWTSSSIMILMIQVIGIILNCWTNSDLLRNFNLYDYHDSILPNWFKISQKLSFPFIYLQGRFSSPLASQPRSLLSAPHFYVIPTRPAAKAGSLPKIRSQKCQPRKMSSALTNFSQALRTSITNKTIPPLKTAPTHTLVFVLWVCRCHYREVCWPQPLHFQLLTRCKFDLGKVTAGAPMQWRPHLRNYRAILHCIAVPAHLTPLREVLHF